MNLIDVLNWIVRYPGYAFFIGCFIISGLAIVCNGLVRIVRSFTGKYPAPSPVVQCNCDNDDDAA